MADSGCIARDSKSLHDMLHVLLLALMMEALSKTTFLYLVGRFVRFWKGKNEGREES